MDFKADIILQEASLAQVVEYWGLYYRNLQKSRKEMGWSKRLNQNYSVSYRSSEDYCLPLLVAANQVADETGADAGAGPVHSQVMEHAAYELAAEKRADQNRKRHELPAHAREHAEGDYEGDRQMHREKPARRELPLIRPPVAEGKVKKKNKKCHRQNIHTCLLLCSLFQVVLILHHSQEDLKGKMRNE